MVHGACLNNKELLRCFLVGESDLKNCSLIEMCCQKSSPCSCCSVTSHQHAITKNQHYLITVGSDGSPISRGPVTSGCYMRNWSPSPGLHEPWRPCGGHPGRTAVRWDELAKFLHVLHLFSKCWSNKILSKAMSTGKILWDWELGAALGSSEEFRKLFDLPSAKPLVSLKSAAELAVTSSVQDRVKKHSACLTALPMAMSPAVTSTEPGPGRWMKDEGVP